MFSSRLRLSLSQQWLLIAVVTMIPLLSVVAYATWSFYHQMQEQREIILRSDSISDIQLSTTERVRELERYARQYRLLRDARFLQPSIDTYQRLQENLNELRAIAQGIDLRSTLVAEQQHTSLDAATEQLQRLMDRLKGTEIDQLDEAQFSSLLSELAEFRPQFDNTVARYLQQLRERGEQELQRILWHLFLMGLITIPLTLALMGVGFSQMLKPIRRLSKAILNLGHGNWETAIDIDGPKDFQNLGGRLEWMRGQLLEADDQKRTFLRHVSHELKTPLSTIMEAVSLLEDQVPGKINDQQRDVLQILHDNSKNLKELIQQLLNYNVITHSFSTLRTDVDVKALCESIVSRLNQQSFHHKIEWRIQGEVSRIETDLQLLEMIMSNLLSNAYHYSPTDSVVTIRWGLDGNQGSQAQQAWISVQDQGPGIDESERTRIFEPFVQGRVKRHGPVRGSGVGLAIVSESVTKLGGYVEVDSAPGKGSRFLLRFPLAKPTEESR